MSSPQDEQKKYVRKYEYSPEYPAMMEEYLAKGYSIEAFAGSIRVTRGVIREWLEKYPELKDACEVGTARAAEFYDRMGVAGMTGKLKGFNFKAWQFNVGNRFGWKPVSAIEHSGPAGGNIKVELILPDNGRCAPNYHPNAQTK